MVPTWMAMRVGDCWSPATAVLGESGAMVAWILIPLFVAVGLYLLWYSARRRRMLEAFARDNQLFIRPEHLERLDRTLDACFSQEGQGLVRSFAQLSSLVDGDEVWLFGAVELLDLNPHGESSSTHSSRIAVLFDVPDRLDEFFLLDRSLRARPCLPGAGEPDPEVAGITRRIGESCQARHAMSVTLSGGHGLIYFEPLVVGGESRGDVEVLYRIGQKIRAELAEPSASPAAL